MALLKEDGGLDIERINQLPFEEYMKEMGSLTEAQVNEYLSVLSINESNEPAKAVEVEYTLKDEIEQGAVIASDYIKNKVRELRQK